MNILFSRDLCAALVLTFGHFLWIGTLIAIVTSLVVRRQRTSRGRYGVWLTGLLVMAGSPVLTFAILQVVPAAQPVTVMVSPAPPIDPRSQLPEGAPTDSEMDHFSDVPSQMNDHSDELLLKSVPSSPIIPVEAPKAPEPTDAMREPGWWRDYAPLVMSLYLIGVALMGLRLSLGLWGGHKLRYQSELITQRWMLDALQRQADALGLILVPAMAYCERVTVPTVLGILQPMILLPMTLASGLTPDQIDSVLAHELAHLRRYDHFVNLLQCVIESLLFFHPAVWWLSRRVRDEREHCCDDLVIASGAIPLDYAASLLRVAELSREAEQRVRNQRRTFTAASLFATGDRPSTLRQRISRLLGYQTELHVRAVHPWVLFCLATCCVGAIGVLSSMTWNVIAEINRDHSRTKVIVEWSAMVDASVINEIRALKSNSSSSSKETGTETIRCSADELRSIIKRRLDQPKATTVGDRFEILRSRPAVSRRNVEVLAWHFGDTIKNGDKGPNPVIGWNVHGKCWVEEIQNAVKLEGEADIGSSGSYLHITRAKIKFEEVLADGQAIAFAVTPSTSDSVDGFRADEWKPTLIFVYEACEVPTNQVDLLKPAVRAKDWIQRGASGSKEHIARIADWRSRATQDFATSHNPEWTHELPHGGKIELLGIGRPQLARLIWWDPLGNPISGDDLSWGDRSPDELIGVVRISEGGVERRPHASEKDTFKLHLVRDAQFAAVPIKKSGSNDGTFTLKVGAGFGPWTSEAKIAPLDNATTNVNGVEFRVAKVFDFSNKIFHVHFHWKLTQDIDVGVVAIKKDGKVIAPFQDPTIASHDLNISVARTFEFQVPLTEIDHLLIQTRPRQWTEFTGFSTEPAVAPKPQQFLANLPNGLSVEFVGLAEMGKEDKNWWKPDGEPLDQVPAHKAAGIVSVTGQEMRRTLIRVHGARSHLDVTTNMTGERAVEATDSGESFVSFMGGLGFAPPQKTARVEVGVATVPLSPLRRIDSTGKRLPNEDNDPVDHVAEDITILSVAHPRLRALGDHKVNGRPVPLKPGEIAENDERRKQTEITFLPPVSFNRLDLQLMLIDTDGQTHTRHSSSFFFDKPEVRFTFNVPLDRVARFEYRLRPFQHWVTFDNVSVAPGNTSHVKVTVASLPTPKPPHYIANLPDGRSVEFVGITKNTAAAKEGWKPDGRPIGDVGYWPATNYISGNTHGSFTENGEHPEPNAGAIDLLFRFRGLKAQPSISFDLATKGSSYPHLPLKEPYELRISAERRDPLPPDSKWTIPDGEMRVGLTDEPWGKWLQISPTGEVLNPLTDDDLYRSFYEQIQIIGVEPHERAPNKLALVLRTPQEMSKRFPFEIRGIDPDEKSQWVLQWDGKGIEGTDLIEGRWGLATPEKKPLTRFEFRLRPYRHWVTFTGVSVEPGKESDVKLKAESVNDNGKRNLGANNDGTPNSHPITVRGPGVAPMTHEEKSRSQPSTEGPMRLIKPTDEQLQAAIKVFEDLGGSYESRNRTVDEHTFRLGRGKNQHVTDEIVPKIPTLPFAFGLYLNATQITAKGLRELAKLDNLVALYLGRAQVTDDGLVELARFKNLVKLQISDCDVTETGLKQLGNLQSVRELNIPTSPLSDAWVREAAKIEDLATLRLSNVLSDEGFKSLGRMQNLKKLVIPQGQISDAGWEELSTLRNLSELHLPSDLKLTSANLKQLAKLENLTTLSLQSSTITDDGIEAIAGLGNLKWLDLSDTNISDAGLKHVGGFGELEYLRIESTKMTDVGLKELASLRHLKRLYLGFNRISDDGISELVGLKNLVSLNLYRTDITDRGLKHVAQLPNLAFLDIRHTRITAVGLKELSNLDRLTSLLIAGAQDRDDPMPTLQNIALLKNLTHLTVWNFATPVSATKEISSLQQLTHLGLHGNITDAELRELASSTSIQNLDINSRLVTDKGLQSLANLHTLNELYMRRSQVTLQGKAKLQEALPNCDLDVLDLNQFNDVPDKIQN